MFRTIGYFLGNGFKNIWRNKLMSFASAGIVAASLILFGFFLLAEINIDALILGVEEQCEINVYLSSDTGGATLNQIKSELTEIPGVKDVKFVSKEERIEQAKQTTYQGREYLLEDIEEDNPLRDSYILTAENLGQSEEIAEAASKIQGVDEVINLQEMVDKIRGIADTIRRAGGWLMLILALIAMFIIVNTIRLGLIYRRQEISIMRFVGASNHYICGPFMVEGVILGITGAVLAAILILWGYSAGINVLNQTLQLDFLVLPGLKDVWAEVAIDFLAIGTGIGLIGSGISIRKYLKA